MPEPSWHHLSTGRATPTRLESLPAVLVSGFSAVPGWGDDDRSCVELALSEIATNIVEHGDVSGSGQVRARLEIVIDSRQARVVVDDDAPPADITLGGMPDVGAESGRGLALVDLVTDSFAHTTSADGNRWAFTRARTPADESGPPDARPRPDDGSGPDGESGPDDKGPPTA